MAHTEEMVASGFNFKPFSLFPLPPPSRELTQPNTKRNRTRHNESGAISTRRDITSNCQLEKINKQKQKML